MAKLSFWQKVKKAVSSPLGMGIGMGVGLGVVLAVTSVFAFAAPAIIGGLFFLTGAFAGVLGGGWAQLRANFKSKLEWASMPGAPGEANLPEYQPVTTFSNSREQSAVYTSGSSVSNRDASQITLDKEELGKEEARVRRLLGLLRNK